MALQKIIKKYARATYSVSNKFGSVTASATASGNKDSSAELTANVLAQKESVNLAMIGINKLKTAHLQGISKATADVSYTADTGTGAVTTSTSPYGHWVGPMMTNLNNTPFQLCADETDEWLYYSTDTINWTISTINDSYVKTLGAIAISGINAIGIGDYLDSAQTQYLIYSTDGGQTWTDSSLVMYGGTIVGTLSSQTGYLCTYTINAPDVVNDYYSTSNGGSTWTLMGSYTDTNDDKELSTYSIASSGTNILWSLYNGNIFYSTTTYPSTPPSSTGSDGISTYIGNFSSGTGSSLAISGSYGLVLSYYDIDNMGVYIINLADDVPTLVKCTSAGTNAFQSVYISDTASSDNKISALVSSPNLTMYCDDITASLPTWTTSSTTDIFGFVAISGSTAISTPTTNLDGYINYSSDGGKTWTSTADS